MTADCNPKVVDFWSGRRVFVTGATGLLGSWLVKDLLARGAFVVVLVRDADPQSELYRSGDIRWVSVVCGCLEDFRTLERALSTFEVEVVFHFGAQTIVGTAYRSPLVTLETNVLGTANLLEACRVNPSSVQRVVIASSDKAYGELGLPYTEDMPLQGRYPYDVSKSCTDMIAQSYYFTYHLPVAIARCGNIFGGGDLNWSRIIPGTIRSLLCNQRPVVRSDGQFVRDYLYVKDAVNAHLLLAERLDSSEVCGQAFNFSPGSPVKVVEIVDKLRRLMGREDLLPEIQNRTSGEIRWQSLSTVKAQQVLGWRAAYSLDEGLMETIAWYTTYLQEDRKETRH